MKQEPDIAVPTEAEVIDALEKKKPFDLATPQVEPETSEQQLARINGASEHIANDPLFGRNSPISRFRERFREPTTSDPVRAFDDMLRDSLKEKEVARLMYKIAGGRGYTVSEYREIEATVRKVADLPLRDYAMLDRPKGWQDG